MFLLFFEYILGVDIVYIEEIFFDFLKILLDLCDRNFVVLLLCKLCYDRDMWFFKFLLKYFYYEIVLYDKELDINVYRVRKISWIVL